MRSSPRCARRRPARRLRYATRGRRVVAGRRGEARVRPRLVHARARAAPAARSVTGSTCSTSFSESSSWRSAIGAPRRARDRSPARSPRRSPVARGGLDPRRQALGLPFAASMRAARPPRGTIQLRPPIVQAGSLCCCCERQLAAPLVRLGLDQTSSPSTAISAPSATPRSARWIAAAKSLPSSACSAARAVPRDRARRLAAALEVLGEHHRVALAGALEPLAGEPVAERAVGVGQHRVRGLAHQRVAERVLRRRRGRRRAGAGAMSSRSHRARRATRPRSWSRAAAAEQRDHAAAPEHLAEHARGAQHAARVGARARRGAPAPSRAPSRAARRPRAVGDRADQLLEVERVALGRARRARATRRRRRIVAEHLAHQLLARPAW